MFDINTFLSAALSAAIIEATKPLLERIATLESANNILHKTQHEDMVAMRDRITAIEDSDDRLVDDIFYKVQVQQANITAALAERVAALEAAAPQPVGVDPKTLAEASLNYLNDQEWFWSKINDYVERQMDDHLQTYDHDSYDTVVSDSDDFVKSDDLEDTVRDAVSNLSFEVSVS